MAMLCSHCGKALLKEDARFCNNCGTLVASHPFSPQSLAARKNADAPSMPPAALPAPASVEPEKPGIREQIAQQPLSYLAQQAIRDELPDWVNTPEKEQPQDISNLSDTPARPVGKEHVEKALSTMHELRVRVWEQKETISMIAVPETPALAKKIALAEEEIIEKLPTTHLAATSVEQTIEAQPEEEAVEDRPTQLMEVPSSAKASPIHLSKEPTARPHNPALEKSTPRQSTPFPPVPAEIASPMMDAQKMRESYLDEVEHLDTLHLPAQHLSAQFAPPVPAQSQSAPMPVQPALPAFTATQNNAAPVISTPHPHSRNRLPLIVVSVLLLILVLTGVVTWVYLYQPFSVASITQPQQSFKDAALGVSLLYPSGWSAKVDRSKAMLYLTDSSNTAQVTITVANGGGDLNQYLQQQATQLAMTGARSGGPVTFAGASWQQMQGTMQQSGANYTATLFATTHSDHIVTLLQLAQQTVYPDEETIVFAPIRSSLQLA